MFGLVSGAIINIFGDWFLMERLGFGVEGAGISTAVSQIISFFILLFMFLSGKTQSKLSVKWISKNFSDVTLICKTGFPSLMRQGLSSVSTMILNGQAGLYGDAAVAAMSIVNRICFFVFAVGLGIGQGFQPVAAFNYGAKKYGRVRKGFYFTWMAGEVLLGGIALIGNGSIGRCRSHHDIGSLSGSVRLSGSYRSLCLSGSARRSIRRNCGITGAAYYCKKQNSN